MVFTRNNMRDEIFMTHFASIWLSAHYLGVAGGVAGLTDKLLYTMHREGDNSTFTFSVL